MRGSRNMEGYERAAYICAAHISEADLYGAVRPPPPSVAVAAPLVAVTSAAAVLEFASNAHEIARILAHGNLIRAQQLVCIQCTPR